MDIRGDSSYELSRQREGGPWHGQRETGLPCAFLPPLLNMDELAALSRLSYFINVHWRETADRQSGRRPN